MHQASVSIFIGGVGPLPGSGRPSGIAKHPVDRPVALGPEGFDGDQQADRKVHGGPEKAVHLFPTRHYDVIGAQFPETLAHLRPGALGENLATSDLDEAGVCIGDVWRLGTALLQVCQPRNPCWKIDDRLGQDGVAAFIETRRICGWYWRVLQPGTVSPGDVLILDRRDVRAPSLAHAMAVWREHRPDLAELESVAMSEGIALGWRRKLLQRLEWLRGQGGLI